jgi:hypothetical protein
VKRRLGSIGNYDDEDISGMSFGWIATNNYSFDLFALVIVRIARLPMPI